MVLPIFFLLFSLSALQVSAQPGDLEELKRKTNELIGQDNFIEALPLIEKLVIAEPSNADMRFYLGHALLAKSLTLSDKTEIQKTRIRARQEMVRAKELGTTISIIDAMINSIAEDGSLPPKYSENLQAEESMMLGEAAFVKGDYDGALVEYQKALQLDSTIYEAALYSGDMYTRKKDYPNAEYWYKQAIMIDPDRETAYRYSATPLMLQQKYDLARDRYIEAFITEPYNRFTATGISQWAQATDAGLGHPTIKIPVTMKEDGKGGYETVLDASILLSGDKKDGSAGWLVYGVTRNDWRKEKFSAAYPDEKVYRHSLQEEVESLRAVISTAEKTKGKSEVLNQSIAILKDLNDKGLLEAYILLAIPDAGIAEDHAAYLRSHRDELRQYFLNYVIH